MTVILESSHQYISMNSGFNLEQNQNVSMLELDALHHALLNVKTFHPHSSLNTYASLTLHRYFSTSSNHWRHHSYRHIFCSDRGFLSALAPDAPFLGASDISQGCCRHKNKQHCNSNLGFEKYIGGIFGVQTLDLTKDRLPHARMKHMNVKMKLRHVIHMDCVDELWMMTRPIDD